MLRPLSGSFLGKSLSQLTIVLSLLTSAGDLSEMSKGDALMRPRRAKGDYVNNFQGEHRARENLTKPEIKGEDRAWGNTGILYSFWHAFAAGAHRVENPWSSDDRSPQGLTCTNYDGDREFA